jgi:hypothetical protein
MSNRRLLAILLAVVFVLAPSLALGQMTALEPVPVPEEPSWLASALQILGLLSPIAFASLLSALKGSNNWWMRIIDVVAFNWGKARNDPAAQ